MTTFSEGFGAPSVIEHESSEAVDDSSFLTQQLCQAAGNNSIFVGATNQLNNISVDNGFQQGPSFVGPAVNADGSFNIGSLAQNNSQMMSPGVDLLQGKLAFLSPKTILL